MNVIQMRSHNQVVRPELQKSTYKLKASFRECPVEERKLFCSSRCLMPISVGQPAHEGEKFEATIELVNRSFESCVILVDDSLQRHTMQIGRNERINYYEKSLREGDAWIERNQHVYGCLTIPFRLIRWDRWLQHKRFPELYRTITDYYNENYQFKRAIDVNIHDFLNRYQKRHLVLSSDYLRSFDLCLQYLKEECAAMCLWPEEECEFELYPAQRNQAMTTTYNCIIAKRWPELLRPVSLRFKKYFSKSLFKISDSSEKADD